jgi:adenylyltransferase/sulfurtransferase
MNVRGGYAPKTKIGQFLERYSRLMLIKEIGISGIKKLADTRVAILGCGATGSVIAELLARLGVGFIRLVDRDFIEISNLPRTHLYTENDVKLNLPKAIACANHIKEINSDIEVDPRVTSIISNNIEDLIKDVDIVFDGTDNFSTRYLINEASIKLNKPWVLIGVERWYGNVKFIVPEKTACLRCLLPIPPRDVGNACDILGIVNTTVSLAASIAVSEVLKYILKNEIGDSLYVIDSYRNEVSKIRVSRRNDCVTCGQHRFELLKVRVGRARAVCGSRQVEVFPPKPVTISTKDLSRIRSDEIHVVNATEYVARLNVADGSAELVLFNDGRAIVLETLDEEAALRMYDKLFNLLAKQGIVQFKT